MANPWSNMSIFSARCFGMLLALPIFCISLRAAPALRLSSAGGPAGADVTRLLTVSGAREVAGIRTQINFDPQVLSFQSASRGQLGSLFDFSAEASDGCLYLTFARPDQLSSGQGILARLTFTINAGAPPGLRTDLAMAQALAVNERGAKLALEAAPLTFIGPSVSITNRAFVEFVDLDADGLADDWEDAHNLPTDRPNAFEDPDQDGLVNLLEFALGSDPATADAVGTLTAGRIQLAGEEHLTVSYTRSKAAVNCEFDLERSADLVNWVEFEPESGAVDLIDLEENERVVVRDTQPARSNPVQFFRLRVLAR